MTAQNATPAQTRIDINAIDWEKNSGLVPVIVQHAHDGRVLMLGYTDRAALECTLATGEVHFHSRSRQRLWHKGETSGHVLKLVSIASDCDNDALLCLAIPQGPTCHRGTASCFDAGHRAHPWLNELGALIAARHAATERTGYVGRLFDAGCERMAQKLGEEGIETALAAVAGDRSSLANEAADLLFHLLVLLRARDLDLADVVAVLADRHPA